MVCFSLVAMNCSSVIISFYVFEIKLKSKYFEKAEYLVNGLILLLRGFLVFP